MPQAGDLILVNFLESQPESTVFERKRNSWPLHITLVSWFHTENEAGLRAVLGAVAGNFLEFTLRVGPLKMFGENSEVAVNIIENQSSAKQLHQALMDGVVETGGVIMDEHWIGEHYTAHITRHDSDDGYRNEGDMVTVTDFHLVRLLDDNICEVGMRFSLGVAQ